MSRWSFVVDWSSWTWTCLFRYSGPLKFFITLQQFTRHSSRFYLTSIHTSVAYNVPFSRVWQKKNVWYNNMFWEDTDGLNRTSSSFRDQSDPRLCHSWPKLWVLPSRELVSCTDCDQAIASIRFPNEEWNAFWFFAGHFFHTASNMRCTRSVKKKLCASPNLRLDAILTTVPAWGRIADSGVVYGMFVRSVGRWLRFKVRATIQNGTDLREIFLVVYLFVALVHRYGWCNPLPRVLWSYCLEFFDICPNSFTFAFFSRWKKRMYKESLVCLSSLFTILATLITQKGPHGRTRCFLKGQKRYPIRVLQLFRWSWKMRLKVMLLYVLFPA